MFILFGMFNFAKLLDMTTFKKKRKNNVRKSSTNLILKKAKVQSFQTLDNICVVP